MMCLRCREFIAGKEIEKDRKGNEFLVISDIYKHGMPMCGFDDDGKFKADNWACQTLLALRDKAEYNGWCNDESLVVIPNEEDGNFLILSFYKRRGRTGNAFMVCDNEPIVPLTLEIAENILEDE